MSPAALHPTVDRRVVGIVEVTADGGEVLVVSLVARRWATEGGDQYGGRTVTTAPVGVEVRREPPTAAEEVGGLTAARARELAALLLAAAQLAEKTNTPSSGAAPPRGPLRRATSGS